MKFHFRLLITLFYILTSNQLFSQNSIDSVSYETNGEINIKIIFNQYFNKKNWSDSLLNPWGYQFRESNYPEKDFFVFDCTKCHNDNLKNILFIDSINYKINRLVHKDSIDCCIQIPLLETSIMKRYQEIRSSNWNLISEIIDDGCQDTHYSNLVVKNKKGQIIFKNLNNVRVYEIGWFTEKSYLYVVSTRLCRNEIIIYKIEQ